MKERTVTLLLAAGAALGALGLAEVGLRWLAPVPDPYAESKVRRPVNQFIRSAFTPGLRIVTDVEPGLPGVEGPNQFSVNNMGFRGDSIAAPKPAGEYRVFLIGGSTTECLYLDDADALNAVVQRALQPHAAPGVTVRVYSAGKSGDRSDDHVSVLVHRILHLQPDLVVLFSGINDLNATIYGHDYLHFLVRNPDGTTASDTLGLLPLLRLAATEFQLPRRLYYLAKRVTPVSEVELLTTIPLRSSYRPAVEERRRAPSTPDPPPVAPEPYRVNVRTFVAAARAAGAEAVLMTQQTTWASTVDPGVEEWQWMLFRNGRTYEPGQMSRALEALNDVLRSTARDLDVALYDLARTLPKSREYFYDDVHFTTRGAQRAGEALATVIRATDHFPSAVR